MATVTRKFIKYPTSDGKPMAETDVHRNLMVDVIETLKGYFAETPGVYVSGNLLVYYEEGKPRKHLAPDTFVAWGVSKIDRLYYKVWEEGVWPGVVIEITSKTTRSEDVKKKFAIYQDIWKVKEYFLFDPMEDYLDPSMHGYRLVRGTYQLMNLDDSGRLYSKMLDLDLERRGNRLIFRDPRTHREILRPPFQQNMELRTRAEIAEAEIGASAANWKNFANHRHAARETVIPATDCENPPCARPSEKLQRMRSA